MNRPRYNYTWVVPVQYRTDASPAVTTVLLTASTNSSNAQVSSEPPNNTFTAQTVKTNSGHCPKVTLSLPLYLWEY